MHRYSKTLLGILLSGACVFGLHLLSVNHVYAQADCQESGGEHWRVPAYVYDQEGIRRGVNPDTTECSNPLDGTVNIHKTGGLAENWLKDIEYDCTVAGVRGGFEIRPYKSCHHMKDIGLMSATLDPAPGYSCTTWSYCSTNAGFGSCAGNVVHMSGTGCRADFLYPPGDDDRQLIMRMSNEPTIPPTEPPSFSCPTSFTVACNAAGNGATFSWNSTGAPEYQLRVNASPGGIIGGMNWFDWYNPAEGDWGARMTSTFYTDTVIPGVPYRWGVESITPLNNPSTSIANMCQAPSSFTCIPPSPTPTTPPGCIDSTPPPIPPNRVLSCAPSGSNFTVTYSYDAVSDVGCAGMDTTNTNPGQGAYWSQISSNPGFGTVYGSNNGWMNGSLMLSRTVTVPPNTTVYAHVRARDRNDNQSSWSPSSSLLVNGPNCGVVPDTPTPIPTDTPTPTPVPNVCGDGNPGGPGEQCDDGHASGGADRCDTQDANPNSNGMCTWTFCGDGTVQTPNGKALGASSNPPPNTGFNEVCDDGNSNNNDDCIIDPAGGTLCQQATCGDGYVCTHASCVTGPGGGPEQCDPAAGPGCNPDCTINTTYSNLCHFPPTS